MCDALVRGLTSICHDMTKAQAVRTCTMVGTKMSTEKEEGQSGDGSAPVGQQRQK